MTQNNLSQWKNNNYSIELYDQTRYLQLLKKQNDLIKKGKCLLQENEDEGFEFLTYEAILENQFLFNRREKYRNVVKEYLTGQIEPDDVKFLCLMIWEEDMPDFEKLLQDPKEVSQCVLQSETEGFSDIIDRLIGNAQSFDLLEYMEPNEMELRKNLEKINLLFESYH